MIETTARKEFIVELALVPLASKDFFWLWCHKNGIEGPLYQCTRGTEQWKMCLALSSR